MRTITSEELREILSKHAMWLRGEEGGIRADLHNTSLSFFTDFSGTDLRSANFAGADLYRTNLSWADLRGADLYGSDLTEAYLTGAKIDWPLICPESGSFLAWKKCLLNIDHERVVIVKLEIPEDALRSSSTTRKCRANMAKVLSIETLDGEICAQLAHSAYDPSFEYQVGKTVSVDDFDMNRWNECSTGIHFFMTREDAVNYIL